MHFLRKNFFAIVVITILISVGILFITLNPVLLINIFMYAVAVLLITMAIGFIITSQQYVGNDKTKLIGQSVLLIILSILLILYPNHTTRMIIGIIFLLIPIVELFYANNKLEQLKKDIWKYIVGVVLILSFKLVLKIIFVCLGVIVIVLAGYLVYLLYTHRKDDQNILIIMFLKQFLRKEENDTWEL